MIRDFVGGVSMHFSVYRCRSILSIFDVGLYLGALAMVDVDLYERISSALGEEE